MRQKTFRGKYTQLNTSSDLILKSDRTIKLKDTNSKTITAQSPQEGAANKDTEHMRFAGNY